VVVPVVDARRGQVFGCVYGRAEAGEVWRRLGSIFAAAPEDVDAAVRSRANGFQMGRVTYVGRTDLLPPELLSADRARALLRDVEASFLVRGHHRMEGPENEGMEGRALVSWLAGAIWDGERGGDVAHPGDPGTPEAVRPIYVRAPDADLHITKMKDPWEA
jgi:hypothetical protein